MSECVHDFVSMRIAATVDMCQLCGVPEPAYTIAKLKAELAALREENDKLRAYGVADPRDIDTALEALADQIPACINSLHSWLRCVRHWNTCVENVPKVGGDSDDYIEALKKADETLLEVKGE